MSTAITIELDAARAPTRSLCVRLASIPTATVALVREWHRSQRSRLELASYSHDDRRDLGFAADLAAEISKRFWKP
jgi:uncharacterized protein YjiS (DUF1127 family)